MSLERSLLTLFGILANRDERPFAASSGHLPRSGQPASIKFSGADIDRDPVRQSQRLVDDRVAVNDHVAVARISDTLQEGFAEPGERLSVLLVDRDVTIDTGMHHGVATVDDRRGLGARAIGLWRGVSEIIPTAQDTLFCCPD